MIEPGECERLAERRSRVRAFFVFAVLLVACASSPQLPSSDPPAASPEDQAEEPDAAPRAPAERLFAEQAPTDGGPADAPSEADSAAACPPPQDPCDCRFALDACAALADASDPYICGIAATCSPGPWRFVDPLACRGVTHRLEGTDGCDVLGDVVCCHDFAHR